MNESEIDRLLRQETPEIRVRPGLDTRIRASLRESRNSRRPIAWFALAATCAIALLIALRTPNAPEEPEVVQGIPPVPAIAPGPEAVDSLVPEIDAANPLRSEALALRNDAERTGRFLLDCLPSIAMSEN